MIDFKTLPTPTPIVIIGFAKSELLESENIKEGFQDLLTALYVYINPMCDGKTRQIWANEQHKIMKRIRNDALAFRHLRQKEYEASLAVESSIYEITHNVRVQKLFDKGENTE